MSAICLPALATASYHSHPLHDGQRNWPETNCYVDLWIELLSSLGFDPLPALGFTVLQDFEGDQFTFFKIPASTLLDLYGITVQELAIFDRVEDHVVQQLRRGRLVLIEVDSFFLPDTRGTSYRTNHGKTTIAVNFIDVEGHNLHYFHNGSYFELSAADYLGVFEQAAGPLYPYVEFVKIPAQRSNTNSLSAAIKLLRNHLSQRPATNPIHSFQAAFPSHLTTLAQRSMEFFHVYSFNTLRQLGANFELMASHLNWLETQGEPSFDTAKQACIEIAEGAKTLQFQLARAVNRKRYDNLGLALDGMAIAYERAIGEISSRYSPI